MNQKQVSEIPNPGNDLTYIVQTAPGVVMNTDVQAGANFSILGMPGFSYLHTIDGMNDNDNEINLSQVGALILLLGQNQIQEATLVSTGYSGQFGGAAGGNINYLTRSGSNEFHGTRSTIGTAACSMPTIGSIKHSTNRVLSRLPISGLVHSAGRSRRTSCSSSSIVKGCGCSFPRISS